LKNEYVICIGEVGFKAISYFSQKYEKFPECTLILSDRERLNISNKEIISLKNISKNENLIYITSVKESSEDKINALLKKIEGGTIINLVFSTSETFSLEISLSITKFLQNKAIKTKAFAIFPFILEGDKKIKNAVEMIENLENVCNEVIVFGRNTYLKKFDRKKTITQHFEIIFEEVAKIITQENFKINNFELSPKLKKWFSDVIKIAAGVFLGILSIKIFAFVLH